MNEKIWQARARYLTQVDHLLNEVSTVPEETLNRLPGLGWSAMQTLHHLVLVERSALAYVRKKLSYQPALERVGAYDRWRSLLLWAGLNVPMKLKAPAAVGDEHLPATSTLAQVGESWEKVRADWQEFLDQLPAELADKAIYRHPRAGRLGWVAMFDFLRHHLLRHRLQIRRAVKAAQYRALKVG